MLQADGGTRTAAITGAYVALAEAVTWLAAGGKLADPRPPSCAIAAVSVGVVDGRIRTDLPYTEDSRAEVDMNVVATDTGTLVEIQGRGLRDVHRRRRPSEADRASGDLLLAVIALLGREVGTGAAAVPQVGQRLADGLEFGLLHRIGR